MTVDGSEDEGTRLGDGAASVGEPAPTESPEESHPARPATDWERYGHRTTAPIAPPRGLQPDVIAGRRGRAEHRGRADVRDDLYADYRREGKSSGLWRKEKPSRRRANLVGVGLVFAVAVMFVVAGIVATESNKPAKTPLPTASPAPTPLASPSLTPRPLPTAVPPIVGTLAMVADLPSGADAPDRSMPQEDGGMLYLAGNLAGLQINTQTAEIKSRSVGYGTGIARQVVAGGSVWRGTSSPVDQVCGPSCWAKSTTYKLDAATGSQQNKYAGTYLVGYDGGLVWIASSKGVQALDPGTGSVLSTTPWKSATEPRVGCGALWSVSQAQGAATLRIVNASGAIGQDNALGPFFYGPVQVHGLCWTIDDGIGGAVLPPTALAVVEPNSGKVSAEFSESAALVLLDGEFWTYEPGGLLQRYDPTIGTYGSKVQLAVVPVIDNPLALFSAMHKLWAIDGQRLLGFDVTTGATGTGS